MNAISLKFKSNSSLTTALFLCPFPIINTQTIQRYYIVNTDPKVENQCSNLILRVHKDGKG